MSDGGPAPMVEDAVEATQADRDAAADVGRRFAHWTEQQVAITVEGRGDKYPIVQAFARHRLAALQTADATARTNEDFKTDFKTAQAVDGESQ